MILELKNEKRKNSRKFWNSQVDLDENRLEISKTLGTNITINNKNGTAVEEILNLTAGLVHTSTIPMFMKAIINGKCISCF